MKKLRNFSDQFKAAVTLEALRDDKTVQEIAVIRAFCSIGPNGLKADLIRNWTQRPSQCPRPYQPNMSP